MRSDPNLQDHYGHDHDHKHDCVHHARAQHGHDHEHHHGPEAPRGPKRPGILLAAFGTAVIQARQAYDGFEAQVRSRYPDIPVAWAFTAHKVRRKLAGQGLPHDCVAVALSRMHDQGVTHLAIQSLHTIPGVEYFWTLNLAKAYEHPRKGFHQVSMGAPLLSDQNDLLRASACLSGFIPAQRKPDEAVILAGHGTYHDGQQQYLALQTQIQGRDPLLFMALLMGEPGIQSITNRLRAKGVSTVWLLPFMAVSGHHVRKDMFGDHPRSWSNQLRAAGFQVMEHATGTIQSPCFQSIWLDHLESAVNQLGLHTDHGDRHQGHPQPVSPVHHVNKAD